MSQAGITNTSSGPISPTVPTSFTTQSGSAVPALNTLIIDAFDSTEDNINGIVTKGGVAAGDPPGSGLSNELSIYLTNRYAANLTTTDATQTALVVVPTPLNPAVYNFTGTLNGYDVTNNLGVVTYYSFSFRTTAGPGVPIQLSPLDTLIQQDPTIGGSLLLSAQGAAQTFTIFVTGAAATIFHWHVTGTYTVVS